MGGVGLLEQKLRAVCSILAQKRISSRQSVVHFLLLLTHQSKQKIWRGAYLASGTSASGLPRDEASRAVALESVNVLALVDGVDSTGPTALLLQRGTTVRAG